MEICNSPVPFCNSEGLFPNSLLKVCKDLMSCAILCIVYVESSDCATYLCNCTMEGVVCIMYACTEEVQCTDLGLWWWWLSLFAQDPGEIVMTLDLHLTLPIGIMQSIRKVSGLSHGGHVTLVWPSCDPHVISMCSLYLLLYHDGNEITVECVANSNDWETLYCT